MANESAGQFKEKAEDGERRAGDGGLSSSPSQNLISNSKEDVRIIAQKLAMQPVPVARSDAWGVLTAISEKARKRPQGSKIMLHKHEHVLGRTVKEAPCQFDSPNVSARHCKIIWKRVKVEGVIEDGGQVLSESRAFIKDTSSNGTFINWQKLKRDSPEVHLRHGDIISLVNVPENENAFAFVFREVAMDTQSFLMHQLNGTNANSLKRKLSDEEDAYGAAFPDDGKRIKGLGIGGPDGPVSLDDVRRLQRSNEELRQQLEACVLTIEKLRAESRAAAACHDAEIKELRESVSATFSGQIKELQDGIAKKEKEAEELTSLCSQQQTTIEDLNRHLAATIQSKNDAEEMIKIQGVTITEIKEQLEEERTQRREEREKAESDLKAAVERTRLEGFEELKRQSEAAARQHKEQMDMINKLEEADKENRLLIETLMSKLQDLRENLVKAQKNGCELESQLHDEKLSSASARKKVFEREHELQQLAKELESEKAARQDALAKISTLELEMESAMQDLTLEKQRLQGARECILLRETQLRAFHSTTEEIAALQQKQQDQLKAMLRTLEDGDEDDYANIPNQAITDVRRNNITGDCSLAGKEKEAGSGVKLLSSNKCAVHGIQENIVANKREGDIADSKSNVTVGKHNADETFNRNAGVDWVDGETQEDDTGEAQLANAPPNIQIANSTMILLNECVNSDGYNGEAEMGYTQLEIGYTEAGKYSCIPSEKDVGETQALGNGQEEGTNLETPLHHKRNSIGEETHQPSRTMDVEKVKDEEAVGFVGETMLLEGDDEHEFNCWGKSRLALEGDGVAMEMEDNCEQTRLHDLPGQHASTSRTLCPPMKQRRKAHVNMSLDESESTRKRDGPMTTLDLLASEVAGSWAISTPASVHGDNECSQDDEEGEERITEFSRYNSEVQLDAAASQVGSGDSEMMRKEFATPIYNQGRNTELLVNVVGSQNSLSPGTAAWHSRERHVLNEMLDIVDPGFVRRHGMGRGIGAVAGIGDHINDSRNREEICASEGDSTGSEPTSQS